MTSAAPKNKKLVHIAFAAAWLTGVLICWNGEATRLSAVPQNEPGWVAVITNLNHDTSLFVPLLLVAPFIWFFATRSPRIAEESNQAKACSIFAAAITSLCVGAVAFVAALSVGEMEVSGTGTKFGSLPPAYHDEYSYLLQAHTFLAGRTSFPSREPDGVFDQMHVLNDDGVFASRYFPATGLWLAPFVAIEKPWLGNQIANGLIAFLFCFAACRCSGLVAGVVTGLLIAAAPGMAVFSNLLLAHHATLIGLGVFTVSFFESRKSRPFLWTMLGGCGLAFAMLARPMSAAGFALPFGLCVLAKLLSDRTNRREHIRQTIGLGVPILCGFAALATYNHSVTGDYLTTPYSVYTNLYTPNHVYGFDNVTRGDTIDAPKRIDKYDGWAENLTPALAAKNMSHRIAGSFRWTMGLIPTAMLAIFSLLLWARLKFEARLTLGAILTLHLAHIPYWFDGIMHYHYVFETSVLWCLLAGLVAADIRAFLQPRFPLPAWCFAMTAAAALAAWIPTSHPLVANTPLFAKTRIQREIDGIAFSRLKYERFNRQLKALPKPALVLVQHDQSDIHIDYVSNLPMADGPDVLIGRLHEFRKSKGGAGLFANMQIFTYEAKAGTFQKWQP